MCWNLTFFCPSRNSHIKTGIVYKNNRIGFKSSNIFFTDFDVVQNGFQIQYYFNKTHKSQLTVMFYHSAANRLHQIATPKRISELGFSLYKAFIKLAPCKSPEASPAIM